MCRPHLKEWYGGATGHTRMKLRSQTMPSCSTCSLNGLPTQRPAIVFSSKTLKLCTALQNLAKAGVFDFEPPNPRQGGMNERIQSCSISRRKSLVPRSSRQVAWLGDCAAPAD